MKVVFCDYRWRSTRKTSAKQTVCVQVVSQASLLFSPMSSPLNHHYYTPGMPMTARYAGTPRGRK